LSGTQEIADFLAPSLTRLHDPGLLPDIAPAIERLAEAVAAREHVLVHGDYDADGLTGAALLCKVLSRFGCQVQYHIPHRLREQYGLSKNAVERAGELGATLVVAVDCGVSDFEAIALAKRQGMDVIVIDHHEPAETLPPGAWIVDPKRADSRYPERDLAAVGLAFKVASALCRHQRVSEASLQRACLDLVAIGTVADVVPLRGENRILASAGLQVLSETRSPGLKALLEIAGVTPPVRATDIAFRLAPRLNAVGRVGDGADGLDMLLSDNPEEARRLALHLDSMNRDRQREQETVYVDALRLVDEQIDLDKDRVIVLASPGWHVGVVGIVASKILERYHRPAIMLVEENGHLRGSARSLGGFDITAALGECSECLLRFGGHALAAGLTLRPEDFEEFRTRLNLVAEKMISGEERIAHLNLDAELELADVDETLLEALKQLEPYGHSNSEPLFLTRSVEVVERRSVGQDGRHLKLYVRQGDQTMDCIGFGLGVEGGWVKPGALLDLAHTPEFNDFAGKRSLQLRLEAIRPAEDPREG
jgi:single-stranded-DNA-specific exonuclease